MNRVESYKLEICLSYLTELFQGIHRADDVYKIALFTSAAGLDYRTRAYNPKHEVSGPGYLAGGQLLTGFRVGSAGRTTWLDFDDVLWPNSSISGARYALIHNPTQDGAAVAVLDFGKDRSSTNGPFELTFPKAGEESALIRLRV